MTCKQCGVEFTPPNRRGILRRTCSDRCQSKWNRLNPHSRPACQCQHCGRTYIPKANKYTTFCSRDCSFAFYANRKATKGPACPVYFPQCIRCQQQFVAKRTGMKYCSRACLHSSQRERYVPKSPRKAACLQCGRSFETSGRGCYSKKYCVQCSLERKKDVRKERKRLSKAKRKKAFVQRVIRREIYERDGWKCGICKKFVNPSLKSPHPFSKTIDHIVPLSKGGTHEPRNVRLAHFGCNSRRSNKGFAQMRLY